LPIFWRFLAVFGQKIEKSGLAAQKPLNITRHTNDIPRRDRCGNMTPFSLFSASSGVFTRIIT
jgi:hypothetical protein